MLEQGSNKWDNLQVFTRWVLGVYAVGSPCRQHKFTNDCTRGGDTPAWISISHGMVLLPDCGHVPATVDVISDPFSENYSDASYEEQHAIVFPVNMWFSLELLEMQGSFKSCDTICETMSL